MTVVIRRRDGTTLQRIGAVQGGEVVDGDLRDLFVDGDPPDDEQELLDRFDGPTLFAARTQTAEGQSDGSGPFSHVPVIPDDPDTLTRPMLQELVRWKAGDVADDREGVTVGDDLNPQWTPEGDGDAQALEAGEFTRHFNPSLHPRDPRTGQFVERPWDIDLDQQTLNETPTPDLLQFLSDEGEDVDSWIQSDDMTIDGIPNDAEGLDDARRKIRERGTPDPDTIPDPEDLDPDDKGERLSDEPDIKDLSPGDVVLFDNLTGDREVGVVEDTNIQEGPVFNTVKVTTADGETKDPAFGAGNFRRVDPSAFRSVEERELGTPQPDNQKTMTESGVKLPDEDHQRVQDALDEYSEKNGVDNILQHEAATKTIEGARAGASPENTGSMEATEFPVLDDGVGKNVAENLQKAIKDRDDLDEGKVDRAYRDLDKLKGKSYNNTGKTFEVALQKRAGLPGDPRNDDLEALARADDPEYQKAVGAVAAASQKVVENLHDDDEPMYRGLGGYGGAQLSRGFLLQGRDGDTFQFDENVMANYTPAENVADDFGDEFVVERAVNPQDVAHASDNLLGDRSSFRGEGEIALHTGPSTVEYDDVQVVNEVSTLGDVVNDDPRNLGSAELMAIESLLAALQGSDKVEVPDFDELPPDMQDWVENFVRATAQSDINIISGATFGKSVEDTLKDMLPDGRFNDLREQGENA